MRLRIRVSIQVRRERDGVRESFPGIRDVRGPRDRSKIQKKVFPDGSTTFDRRHLTAGRLAAGHLTVRHLTPSRFYRGQLTAKACKRIVMVSCLSVCPSLTLVDCDHTGWNSSKIISRMISPTFLISADSITNLFKREHPQILAGIWKG